MTLEEVFMRIVAGEESEAAGRRHRAGAGRDPAVETDA